MAATVDDMRRLLTEMVTPQFQSVHAALGGIHQRLDGCEGSLRELQSAHSALERRVLATEAAQAAPPPMPPQDDSGPSSPTHQAGSRLPGVVIRGWAPLGSGAEALLSAEEIRKLGDELAARLPPQWQAATVVSRPYKENWQLTMRILGTMVRLGFAPSDLLELLRSSLDRTPLHVRGLPVYAVIELSADERQRRKNFAYIRADIEANSGKPNCLHLTEIRFVPHRCTVVDTCGIQLGELCGTAWQWDEQAVRAVFARRGPGTAAEAATEYSTKEGEDKRFKRKLFQHTSDPKDHTDAKDEDIGNLDEKEDDTIKDTLPAQPGAIARSLANLGA